MDCQNLACRPVSSHQTLSEEHITVYKEQLLLQLLCAPLAAPLELVRQQQRVPLLLCPCPAAQLVCTRAAAALLQKAAQCRCHARPLQCSMRCQRCWRNLRHGGRAHAQMLAVAHCWPRVPVVQLLGAPLAAASICVWWQHAAALAAAAHTSWYVPSMRHLHYHRHQRAALVGPVASPRASAHRLQRWRRQPGCY